MHTTFFVSSRAPLSLAGAARALGARGAGPGPRALNDSGQFRRAGARGRGRMALRGRLARENRPRVPPAARRAALLAGPPISVPVGESRRHAACEPSHTDARAAAKEHCGGTPPKFAAPARVRHADRARRGGGRRHSAAARARAHLGVAVGGVWMVYSVAHRPPGPSVPRAAPCAPPLRAAEGAIEGSWPLLNIYR